MNSLATLRDAAERSTDFRSKALDSVAHVKSLLVMLCQRLELKGKKFSSFCSATEAEIESMWEEILIVDSSLKKDESITKKTLPSKKNLIAFLNHCCTRRHYSFQIKKCDSDTCDICNPVRLPKKHT